MRKRIGRWRVEGELGAGGMGAVYLAQRRGVRAAVKVVHPALAADPQFRTRFQREVGALKRLHGPYLAEFIDADVHAREPWLATQFVDGPTLAQEVARHGPLTDEQSLALALSLASALNDIHTAGIVHRDLKPANVILAASHPVVIDFGIAALEDATSLTRTGMVMGSAGWMSPEQLRGETAGSASDVFSWAGVVTFASTGAPPFGHGPPEAAGHRVLFETPNLEGVAPALRSILEQALEKDPRLRPSAEDLVVALQPHVGQAPTVAESVTRLWTGPGSSTFGLAHTTARRTRRPRSRWALVAAVVICTAGLAAVGLRLLGGQDGRRAQRATPPSTVAEVSTTSRGEPVEAPSMTPSTTTIAVTVPTTTTTTTAPEIPTTTSPAIDRFPMRLEPDGRPIEIPVGHTRVRDCLTTPALDFPLSVSESVLRVPCGHEHLMEVMGHVRFHGDESEDVRFERTDAECRRIFDEYVGVPLGVEWISLTFVVPQGIEWEHGWRESICLVVGTEGIPMTGTSHRIRE